MTKNKKRILTVFVFVVIAALIISSIYLSLLFLPRVLGSEETKALYGMKDVLHSYVNPKTNDLIDFTRHFLGSGKYKFEDGKLKYHMYMKTGDEFADTISDIPSLCHEIKDCVNHYSVLSDENTDIQIDIENWSEWDICIDLKADKITLGLNDRIPITDALDYCKEFETIYVGGYWGYFVLIPDNFDSSYFSDFDMLKVLKIDKIKYEDEENELKEALSDLSGVNIIIG